MNTDTAPAAPAVNVKKLAKDHSRYLGDARWYRAQGNARTAARREAAARKVEAALIEAGHRKLVGELTELSNLYATVEGSVTERPDLRDRVCLTLDRIYAITSAA